MKFSSVASLTVFLFLFYTTSAADTSCVTITLPNIAGIGQCFNTVTNTCNGTTTNVAAVVQLITCAIKAASQFNTGSQLYLLQGIFSQVLQRDGLSVVSTALFAACKIAMAPGLNCNGFKSNGTVICNGSLSITLPSSLGAGTCQGTGLQSCNNGAAATDNMIIAVYKAFTCIFEKTLNTNADALLGGLTCSVLNTTLKLMGAFGSIEDAIINALTDAIGVKGCSN